MTDTKADTREGASKPKKTHGGRRPGGGRKPKGDAPLTRQINLWLTERQHTYLGCAAIMKLDPQDLVRRALDKWIEEQAGGPSGQDV